MQCSGIRRQVSHCRYRSPSDIRYRSPSGRRAPCAAILLPEQIIDERIRAERTHDTGHQRESDTGDEKPDP